MKQGLRVSKFAGFALLALTGMLLLAPGCGAPEAGSPLVVGYSTGAVLHAQIGTIWQNTDILSRHGFKAQVFPIRQGSEQARRFKSGSLDVGFGREVSTVQALLSDPGLRIIASPGELGRLGLVVSRRTGIDSVAGLQGRVIGLPLGTNAHKALRQWVPGAARLQPLKPELETVRAALLAGSLDAVVLWDPLLQEVLQDKSFRVLVWRTFDSHMLARAAYLQQDARRLKALRAALADALAYLQAYPQQVNLWAAHAMQLEPGVVAAVAKYNSFYAGKRKPTIENMQLTPAQVQALQQDWAFLQSGGGQGPAFNLAEAILP